MILSHGRNYIFIHIPKTGGTAMALALEGRAMKDDVMLGDTPKAKQRRGRVKDVQTRGRLWKHSTLSDLEGLVSEAEMRDLFTFTLVRNPWDRVVSYYHWLQAQSFEHIAVARAKALSFAEFLRAPEIAASLKASTAASYMTTAGGIECCDAYLRLEHFEEDSAPLWQHLGFTLELPRANASAREKDYRSYYAGSDASLLAEICAEDIARFGYSFE